MAQLYDILAQHYENLFPLPEERASALTALVPIANGRESRVLDAGCATGALARRLAARGFSVTGVDLNASMLEEARWFSWQDGLAPGNPTFLQLDLLELEGCFPPNSLDAIFCIGNTLPHLGPDAAIAFLRACRRVLVDGGLLLLGMVHFEPILAAGGKVFPDLEVGGVIFRRNYKVQGGEVQFEALLETERVVSESLEDEGSWPETIWKIGAQESLMPYGRDQVMEMLEAAGFKAISLSPDLQGTSCGPADPSTFFTCRV